jgi:hypothetical protein
MCADAMTKNLGSNLAKEHSKTVCG